MRKIKTVKLVPEIKNGKLVFKQIGEVKEVSPSELLSSPIAMKAIIDLNIDRFFIRLSKKIIKGKRNLKF